MQASKKTIGTLGRLRARPEFLRVQKEGQRWTAKGVIVQAAPNQGLGVRFGLTASKKLSTSAVKRNRVRRRLRAAAMDILSEFGHKDTDYVLIGRPETSTRMYTDLKNDLKGCLEKLHGKLARK